MLLGKVWSHLLFSQLWVNSWVDWVLQPWLGDQSKRRKLNLKRHYFAEKLTLCQIPGVAEALCKHTHTHTHTHINTHINTSNKENFKSPLVRLKNWPCVTCSPSRRGWVNTFVPWRRPKSFCELRLMRVRLAGDIRYVFMNRQALESHHLQVFHNTRLYDTMTLIRNYLISILCARKSFQHANS